MLPYIYIHSPSKKALYYGMLGIRRNSMYRVLLTTLREVLLREVIFYLIDIHSRRSRVSKNAMIEACIPYSRYRAYVPLLL